MDRRKSSIARHQQARNKPKGAIVIARSHKDLQLVLRSGVQIIAVCIVAPQLFEVIVKYA